MTRVFKPDSGEDMALQNDDAGAKIQLNNADTIDITGTVTEVQIDNINIDANIIKSTSSGLTVQAYTAMLLRVNNGDNGIQIYADGSVEFYGDVDINSGTLAGFTIDGSWTAASQTCANLGSVTTADINGGTIGGVTIDGSWTAASQTCADLGTVTTADINGGSVDGITLGTNSAVTEAQIDNINLNLNTIKSTSGGLTIQAYGAMLLRVNDGDNNAQLYADGSAEFYGAVSKASGSFKINHPLENKSETHNLVHSFIEGPLADLIYRGKVSLVDGEATINLDTVSNMTDGTFVALNTNTQCFTTNETSWGAVNGSLSGNILAITAQDDTSTDTISWMVIGERHDKHMLETKWTDENGKVIVEPEKVLENV